MLNLLRILLRSWFPRSRCLPAARSGVANFLTSLFSKPNLTVCIDIGSDDAGVQEIDMLTSSSRRRREYLLTNDFDHKPRQQYSRSLLSSVLRISHLLQLI